MLFLSYLRACKVTEVPPTLLRNSPFVKRRFGAVASKPRPFSPFAFLGGKSNAFSPPTFAVLTAPLLGLRPETKGAIPLGFPAVCSANQQNGLEPFSFFSSRLGMYDEKSV
jgi:hypothetical protein